MRDDGIIPENGVIRRIQVTRHHDGSVAVTNDALLVPQRAGPCPAHADVIGVQVIVGCLVQLGAAPTLGVGVEQDPDLDASLRGGLESGLGRGVGQLIHGHIDGLLGPRDEIIDGLIAGLRLGDKGVSPVQIVSDPVLSVRPDVEKVERVVIVVEDTCADHGITGIERTGICRTADQFTLR